MAKSRDRQTSSSDPRGRKRSPGGREELGTHRRKVLWITGAAGLSRGMWPTRSRRLEEGRFTERRKPAGGEARQEHQRRGERPVTRKRTPRAEGPFARRSESRRRETPLSPQPHDGSENARGAGARSECVWEADVGRTHPASHVMASRKADQARALARGQSSHRWCGWRRNEGEPVRSSRAESIR